MAKIIKDIELFANCENAQEVYEKVRSYTENYLGHVVSDVTEAYYWYKDIYGNGLLMDDVLWGETQDSRFMLFNESAYIHVRIEEIFVDSGSVDYCYIVSVEEE